MKAKEGSFTFQFETFGQMEDALELIFSPSAASVILYTTAIKCGVRSYMKMKEEFNTGKEALNYLSSRKKEENWGKMAFQGVDFENKSGRIVIDDSFEVMTRKTNQPSCHFFRGFLAGFLSELLKKRIAVTEEKCAGKGDKHCEFVFAKQKA
ncbi:MAG: 4-vinyl reductase [Candidatus Bathyarchaeota archaeon]|nr:MAG: 4-vinyl reductase [Candidatus Bathyarchaeota archaeon]